MTTETQRAALTAAEHEKLIHGVGPRGRAVVDLAVSLGIAVTRTGNVFRFTGPNVDIKTTSLAAVLPSDLMPARRR